MTNPNTRFWWFDALFPMALAISLFASLTYVIYAGQKHMRLASYGENGLLNFSLRMASGRHALQRDKVAVVSANEADLARYGSALGRMSNATLDAKSPTVRDLSATAYARVIEKTAHAGANLVVLSWTPNAHASLDAGVASLVTTLARLKKEREQTPFLTHDPTVTKTERLPGNPARQRVLPPQVWLTYPFATSWTLPDAIKLNAVPLMESVCDDDLSTQLACPFDKEVFAGSMIQKLAERAGLDDHKNPFAARISDNLPRFRPSFLLNLSDPDELPTYSVSEVLAPGFDTTKLAGRMVFIGNDLVQRQVPADDYDDIRRAYTVYEDTHLPLRQAGMPYHRLWAEIAQMFVDDALVRIPGHSVSMAALGLFCLGLTALLIRFGGVVALGAYVLFAFAAPLANAAAVRWGLVYVPIFNFVYFGLATLLFAGFSKLSLEAFERWRLEERQKLSAQTLDLKGNFISLLSHNLNTPIAKMQGMLGILAASPLETSVKADIDRALAVVARLETSVRSVLMTSALEEGSLNPSPRTLAALAAEIEGVMGATLRRLGIELGISTGEDELAAVPLRFDPRAVATGLGALVALFAEEAWEGGPSLPVRLRLAVTSQVEAIGEPHVATCQITAPLRLPPAAIKCLQGSADEAETNFYTDVLTSLVRALLKIYRGSIEAFEDAGLQHITLRLQPDSHGSAVNGKDEASL